jgi:hypothetical protein
MRIPITEQELRVENPDNESYQTMVHILNQFNNNEAKRNNVHNQKNNVSVATCRKWEGWYFGK